MNTPIIPQGYHPPSSPGRFSSLQNDDEQSEASDEPESQHKISLRHNKRSHVGYDHFFDVSNPKMYNNDQLTQIITDLQGEDLNKISQALETLYKSSRETNQLFVALNGIDVLIQFLGKHPPLKVINQVLTVLCNLTTLNDTSPDIILLGGFFDYVPQYLSLNNDNISKSTIWILGNLALHSEETHTFICSHPSLLDRIAQFLVVDNYAFSAAAFFFEAIARRTIPDPQIINSLYLNSVESIVQLANGDIFRSTPPLMQTYVHPLDDLFEALRNIDIPYSALVDLMESNFFIICSYYLSDPLYLNCSSSILHFIVSITVYPENDPRTPVVFRIFQSTPLVATILQFVNTIIGSNQIALFGLSLRRCFIIITNLIYDSEDLSKEILDSNILSTILSVVELFPINTLTELVFLLLNLSDSTHEIAQSAIKFNIPRFALVFLRGLTDLSTVSKSLYMLTNFLMKDRTGLILQQIQDLDLIPSIEKLKESKHKKCTSNAITFLLEYQQREQAFQFQAQKLESSHRGESIPDVAVTSPFDDEDYSDSENDDDLDQGPHSPNVIKGAFL